MLRFSWSVVRYFTATLHCEIFYSYFALWDILHLLCIVRYLTATLHCEIFYIYFALWDILRLLCITLLKKRERERKSFFGPSLVEIGQVVDSIEKDEKVKSLHIDRQQKANNQEIHLSIQLRWTNKEDKITTCNKIKISRQWIVLIQQYYTRMDRK